MSVDAWNTTDESQLDFTVIGETGRRMYSQNGHLTNYIKGSSKNKKKRKLLVLTLINPLIGRGNQLQRSDGLECMFGSLRYYLGIVVQPRECNTYLPPLKVRILITLSEKHKCQHPSISGDHAQNLIPT